jgi:hypothetical protein
MRPKRHKKKPKRKKYQLVEHIVRLEVQVAAPKQEQKKRSSKEWLLPMVKRTSTITATTVFNYILKHGHDIWSAIVHFFHGLF